MEILRVVSPYLWPKISPKKQSRHNISKLNMLKPRHGNQHQQVEKMFEESRSQWPTWWLEMCKDTLGPQVIYFQCFVVDHGPWPHKSSKNLGPRFPHMSASEKLDFPRVVQI